MKKIILVIALAFTAITYSCQKGVEAPKIIQKSPVALGKSTTRSFSDFLTAQNTWVGVQYWANTTNVLGWYAANGAFNGTQIRANDKPVPLFVLADYTGIWSKTLKDATGTDLGTSVSGSITETTLSDGTAKMKIDCHAKNAMMWVTHVAAIDLTNYCTGNLTTSDMVYGYRLDELIADKSLNPAVCNVDFTITYIEASPGADFFNVSDFSQCQFDNPAILTDFSITVNGKGILHPASGLVSSETKVNCELKEVVNSSLNKPGTPRSDGYIVEKILFSK